MSKSIGDQLTDTALDPEATPTIVRVTYNETLTVLRKVERPGEPTYWAGTPQSLADGKRCRYGLSVDSEGWINGSAAINFITSKGWRPGSKRRSSKEKSTAAKKFRASFVHALLMAKEEDTTTMLIDSLQAQTGMEVAPASMNQGDLETLALMGIPHDVVQVALANGLAFNLDMPAYIARYVQTTYAACEPGEWDAESEEVSITSSLSEGQVFLLRLRGLRFRKLEVAKRRRRRARG